MESSNFCTIPNHQQILPKQNYFTRKGGTIMFFKKALKIVQGVLNLTLALAIFLSL